MTNYRAKPGGWTDHDADDGKVLAKHLNVIDRNIAGSIDSDGGSYAPSAELRIEGIATSKLGDSYMRGELDRSASGRFRKLVDFTTLNDTAASSDIEIDTTSDIYWSDDTKTQAWTIVLVTESGSGQVPAVDDEIEVSIIGAGFTVVIENESPSTALISFPASYGIQASGSPMYAKFRFGGSTWALIDCSADAG